MHVAKLTHRLFVTATTLMIKNVSATAGADFIQITWSEPKFLPASYRLDVTCWMMYANSEYVCVRLELSPFVTILTLYKLFPESHCVFTLLAIYNPASFDDGITRSIYTCTLNSCVYV